MLTHTYRKKVNIISFSIENETEKGINVEVFGYNHNYLRKQPEGVKFVNLTAGYEDDDNSLTLLQNSIIATGYIGIVMTRVMANSPDQLNKYISLYHRDVHNCTAAIPLYTSEYRNPDSYCENIVDIKYRYILNCDTALGFNMLPFSKYVITLFIGNSKLEVEKKVKSYYTDVMLAYENAKPFELAVKYTEEEKNNLLLISK